MKKTLALTRHLTTSWNREGRLQGHTDIPLDEGGREEAYVLAQKLKNLGMCRAISSDLKRAVETAEIISRVLGLSLTKERRLRECAFGALEGLTRGEAEQKYGARVSAAWSAAYDAYDFSPYGGESKTQVLERHLSLLDDMPSCGQNEKILLVGHGRGLNTLLASLGYPPDIKRGEYRVLEY
ncbi:MAG: hypothetical protein A3D67_03870 [Candidatus Lloydbacteria bacterium RIFCSPHIGHO2_02_FULL_51_22]|uniref:Phosphoglycerate mutase n=2 Tax=Candidatus Lloydiibacteriota TaxID=1817910 RepID=A0A1G2DC39_9BACT|nr:MAG: hypothetical protein A3D67_03870 [Candidatus Lloydbacteria bacterium RIFCSPHIGHO2_02_FULL_51_22]OGZ15464.1 MAG: hypothetical protein A3J08_00925 [Candidatus Lloydbacteria bacterium RIFCSPLOWO2_02_FULL_51_11]